MGMDTAFGSSSNSRLNSDGFEASVIRRKLGNTFEESSQARHKSKVVLWIFHLAIRLKLANLKMKSSRTAETERLLSFFM